MMIRETLTTEVRAECDVLVCGGGFGGIAAALAAARQGKKVILLEKNYMLGGLGTSGLVTIYLPLCDGYGKQVSYGIAEELLRLSISLGHEEPLPLNWLKGEGTRTENDLRFRCAYNPHLCAILMEQLLIREGVKILYGTYAVGASVEDRKITAVIVENKSGRSAIALKSVVDATGDADIAVFAGADTDTFRQGNVLAAWYYSYCEKNGYKLNMLGFCDIPDEQKNESNSVPMLASRRFTGVDGDEISEFMQMSHASTLNDVLKRREENGEDYIPVTIASMPQLRMTRKLRGEYTLSEQEAHTRFEDSVGMIANWRRRGPIYEVPFRTLYSSQCRNLIMAGRCTSVTEPMWDLMRVIPCCAVTGEAAGIAAAMSDDFPALDVKELQARLTERGVVLHESDIRS